MLQILPWKLPQSPDWIAPSQPEISPESLKANRSRCSLRSGPAAQRRNLRSRMSRLQASLEAVPVRRSAQHLSSLTNRESRLRPREANKQRTACGLESPETVEPRDTAYRDPEQHCEKSHRACSLVW